MQLRSLVLLVLVACEPASPSSPPKQDKDPVAQARDEFEVIADEYRIGTSKLYSRGDFLPLDDEKAFSEGDFVGRLRTLFGPSEDDEYVLRHRATGFIVTAYSAQSGPSYGGGPRYPGSLPAPGSTPAATFADAEARTARIKADPLLAKGRPVDWSKYDLETLPPDQLRALREKERVWDKHASDVTAPPGFANVVARLDGLLSAVRPADWDAIRYWSEDPSLTRVGARDGVGVDEAVPVIEGMTYLLAQAEQQESPIKDTAGGGPGDADSRVVDYWLYHHEAEPRIEQVLPRVQAAWFRYVQHANADDESVRTLVLEMAREQVAPLRLDRDAAEAALR
ncbi:MAG TPA: hypothetical protein VM513_11275 [Kofleriaceae bacterium]|jgi:hypothetical protein|nr:hypothetical protein [Kofleriaceae bacterium]